MSTDRLAEVADLAVERARARLREKTAENATHHDLALAAREALTLGTWAPVYANGAFYVAQPGGLWAAQSAELMQRYVAELFNGRAKLCRKASDYRQITDHLAVVIDDPDFFDDAPVGLATPAGFSSAGAAGNVETVELGHEHRQVFALPWRPENDAESVLLDRVLAAAFDGEDAAAQIELWWEAVGAMLLGLMPKLQNVLLLLGRERSGKSLLQRLLERAFPREAVSAVSPASWGHEYHVAALAGKRLNVVGELSDDVPIPAAAFKNVSGQNLITGRHPTHRPFSFRCQAAHCFASNVLPPTTDRSEAFYRRWRVLVFRNTVPAERVDPDLCEKILASEMPALLAQAILGAERVIRAGRIRTTRPHLDVLGRWRHAANPLEQFLGDDEWVEIAPDARVHSTTEVYAVYRRWAGAVGFRNPFGRNHFLELLDATGGGRGVHLARDSRRLVVGLRLLKAEA